MRSITLFVAMTLAAELAMQQAAGAPAARPEPKGPGSYATVNGLRMYYEVHGAGPPLVLLHGGLCTIDLCMSPVLPTLARTHQVIAIELDGHGHTANRTRPLSYDQLADDVAALLDRLKLRSADVFGYSLGANTALRLAVRRPTLVRRLVVLSPASFDNVAPALHQQWKALTPAALPPLFQDAYAKVAPAPQQWPTLVARIRDLLLSFKGSTAAELGSIQAPALVLVGDHDLVLPGAAVKLLGALPRAQLGILPGTGHFALGEHPDWVISMTSAFLAAP